MKVGVLDMKIKTLGISGIARIQDTLSLEFNEGMNIICGVNGTCKTTILDCVSYLFLRGTNSNVLKKNVNAEIGKCWATCFTTGMRTEYVIKNFEPTKNDYIQSRIDQTSQMLYFKTNRNFNYSMLPAIPRDAERNNFASGDLSVAGIPFSDVKGWFANRESFSYRPNALSKEQMSNIETAKKCFSILDSSISFSQVVPDTLEIMVNSQQGEIYFEYLSAGYKSCLYILLGIIKEIEFRFKNPRIAVKDFDGLILIDEVDLHLHPIWQSRIVETLKIIFPHAQIIVTTHSPHIIQSASPNEVIPLVIDLEGRILVNEVNSNEYGFQGWTVEEILVDVMGMRSTKSELLDRTLKDFEQAINGENDSEAINKYDILQKLLHPSNPLKKVLDIQMAGVDRGID